MIFSLTKALACNQRISAEQLRRISAQSARALLLDNGLASLIYTALGTDIKKLSPDTAQFFRTCYEDALVHKDLSVHVLRELQPLLSPVAKIAIMQGLALSHGIYPEPWCRQMSDIDLFVADGSIQDVRARLAEFGFARFRDYKNVWYYKGLCIDLHESLWGEDRLRCRGHLAPDMKPGLVESRLVPGLFILSPRDMALHSVFHGLKHAFCKAVWVLDIMRLRSAGCFENITGSSRRLVSAAFSFMRDAGFIGADEAVAPAPAGDLRHVLARMILNVWRRDGAGEIVLALLCPSWPDTARYVRESLFPPRAILREMYGDHHTSTLYVHRIRALFRLGTGKKR